MERLSHDLNLALEESNCNKHERKKIGLRRRTRSTGNIPASCLGTNEEESSSSPPQAAIISQTISDSDDPQLNQLHLGNVKNRLSHFCPGGNFESDSFNENCFPVKPPNARRKRKFKKMAIDYSDNINDPAAPPFLIKPTLPINLLFRNEQGTSPFTLITKKKRIIKHDCQDGYRANMYSGKRKWSHRERSELGEMRERSFSGGCASKAYYCSARNAKSFLEFKNPKKYLPIKEKLVIPVRGELESALQNISLTTISTTPSLPGSSSFNFIYRPPAPKLDNSTSYVKSIENKNSPKIFSPQFFASPNQEAVKNPNLRTKKHGKSHGRKHKSHHKHGQSQLRNPLQFDDPNVEMDCSVGNDLVSSSSISSSDSEGVVTNDSDREGDDELTDWPDNEEISTFNKNLNLKSQRPIASTSKVLIPVQQKPVSKKDKYLPKQGLSSCKNKTETVLQKTDVSKDLEDMQLMDDDTMMSDSSSVLENFTSNMCSKVDSVNAAALPSTYTSFADVKNAGLLNNNVNEAFFHSFNDFQDNQDLPIENGDGQFISELNFDPQKTSSSEPSLRYCNSLAIRKIRAGCRRLRDERPGFAIHSTINEQLSRFLQDPCQEELKLPYIDNDVEEQEKLASLAKLYSLEINLDVGRPVLKKTSNTTQSVCVEHTRLHCHKLFSEFKRRCYGADCPPDELFGIMPPNSISTLNLDVCGPSSASGSIYTQEPFSALAKVPTVDDLSQSQDYDQGFSSLGNTPPLDPNEDLETQNKSDGSYSIEKKILFS